MVLRFLALLLPLLVGSEESCSVGGAAARAWDGIEAECREKLEKNRDLVGSKGWMDGEFMSLCFCFKLFELEI